ncbi:hypothetical protein L0F63_007479 [Massospora cicadina]|nr:hypothetical protein L0F63_007479 [Massospora cicadina]
MVFINIRDTNKQLSCGVLPPSLDHGFIPSVDKLNECLQQQKSPGLNNKERAEKLLNEIINATKYSQNDADSLYIIDDYDDDGPEEWHKKMSFGKLIKRKDVFRAKLQR